MDSMSSDEAKGLIKSLYDFNFTSLITTKIIRFVYALIVVLMSLGAAAFFLASLVSGGAGVLVALVLVPLLYLIYLIMIRIWMEFLIVVFRMGDDLHAIRISGAGLGGPAPGGPAPGGPGPT